MVDPAFRAGEDERDAGADVGFGAGGGEAEFQVAGGANPATAAAWRGLGISGDGRDLLYGLMTKDRIVTIAPATSLTCHKCGHVATVEDAVRTGLAHGVVKKLSDHRIVQSNPERA